MQAVSMVRNKTERGAVLVHVALGMIAFMAFSALAIDFGVKWVARAQAQNAADAGALAGAIALALDSDDRTNDGLAKKSARMLAMSNLVWGAFPDVTFDDITFPPCPPPDGDDPTGPGPFNCVRVDVYRNQERDNPLPTFFAQLVGVNDQGVRAMAIAKLGEGNNVKCLLPFGVADRWADFYDDNINTEFYPNDGQGHLAGPSPLGPGIDGWTLNDNFQVANGDIYRSPVEYPTPGTHTGYTVEADYGLQLILKFGDVAGEQNNFSAGWANLVDLPNSTGGNDVRDNIASCDGPGGAYGVSIADQSQACEEDSPGTTTIDEAQLGCLSAKTGGTNGIKHGVEDLVESDDDPVVWDPDALDGKGAPVSASDHTKLRFDSKRVRPLPVFDINHYMSQACGGNGGGGGGRGGGGGGPSGGTCQTRVSNILGFFVEGMCEDVALDPGVNCLDPANDVVGRIVTLPAQYFAGGGNVADDAAFLQFVVLVR